MEYQQSKLNHVHQTGSPVACNQAAVSRTIEIPMEEMRAQILMGNPRLTAGWAWLLMRSRQRSVRSLRLKRCKHKTSIRLVLKTQSRPKSAEWLRWVILTFRSLMLLRWKLSTESLRNNLQKTARRALYQSILANLASTQLRKGRKIPILKLVVSTGHFTRKRYAMRLTRK